VVQFDDEFAERDGVAGDALFGDPEEALLGAIEDLAAAFRVAISVVADFAQARDEIAQQAFVADDAGVVLGVDRGGNALRARTRYSTPPTWSSRLRFSISLRRMMRSIGWLASYKSTSTSKMRRWSGR
jgi:hypothetical protein